MNQLNRALTIFIIVSVASSCLMLAKPASAQLSVPEFTVKYIDHSHDIPPTYGIDQYTGKTVVTQPGDHVDNRTIEITIKNQPFTPFTDLAGNSINRFYDVRFKGPFGQNWTEMFGGERTVWYSFDNPVDNYGYPLQDYSSQYTKIIYTLPWNIASEGQMNIQVEALDGYTNRTIIEGHIFMAQVAYTFFGEESGWSETQTITLGANSIDTPNPTLQNDLSPTTIPNQISPTNSTSWTYDAPTQALAANSNQLQTPVSVPLLTFLIVFSAFLAIIAILLILLYQKRRH